MKQLIGYTIGATMLALAMAQPTWAAGPTAAMHKVTQEGIGDPIGTIAVTTSAAGTTLKLDLHGLPPGPHGFHVHENGKCDTTEANGSRVPAGAAGGHLDPDHTGKHAGPAGEGHLGDLPVLEVAADGTALQTLTAPRLKTPLTGHALMIHAGGDNYSDQPSPLGGGGGRIACGVVE